MILAISAGQNCTKKDDLFLSKNVRYINYGLLGLATLLSENAQRIKMFQGNFNSPESLLTEIANENINTIKDCEMILLSIPSNYSISWCQDFCKLVKEKTKAKIIVGGRWVIAGDPKWIKNKIPQIDEVVDGFGEEYIYKSFGIEQRKNPTEQALDYTLLHNYLEYTPSIEVSRGCGRGCEFCLDRNNKRSPNKGVNLIFKEVQEVINLYCNCNIYLEAPHFIFEKKWVTDFCKKYEKSSNKFLWRCTTRIETAYSQNFKQLSNAGLKVIDLGLESASPSQLIAMSKTKNPIDYLNKAESVLKECNKYNIWVKLNILFYPSEDDKTLQETFDWIVSHKDMIKGISVNSLIYYKGSGNLECLQNKGAKILNENEFKDYGYSKMSLGNDIIDKKINNISTELCKTVMNSQDYYELKAFSYFSRNYSYASFLTDINKVDEAKLKFTK